MKDVKRMQGTLHSLLTLINGLEGEELPDLAFMAREILKCVIKDIAVSCSDEPGLIVFDKVFARAGWEGQGLRWCRCPVESRNGRLVMVVRLVQFNSADKTSWEPF